MHREKRDTNLSYTPSGHYFSQKQRGLIVALLGPCPSRAALVSRVGSLSHVCAALEFRCDQPLTINYGMGTKESEKFYPTHFSTLPIGIGTFFFSLWSAHLPIFLILPVPPPPPPTELWKTRGEGTAK